MTKAIIGLGNPGERYQNTRHNAGFMVVDLLAQRWNVDYRAGRGNYVLAKAPAQDAILMKPGTYMNLSGQAVRHLVDYFKVDLDDCMLIYDDLDIPFPEIRLRKQGGAGTHNGVKSVIQHLNTQTFPRTRMGIGGNQGRKPAEHYVLENYSKTEIDSLSQQLDNAADAVEAWLKHDMDTVMNRFNRSAGSSQGKEPKEEI